ncbi:hypothetical protein ZIOFF_065453 [Zingiber officinale]|uniref:GDSL esterase/lipase n=1 Tax=Zingiber officinale TaxID=94328 RepID=A0A8J5EXE4_ZINOF|nr:hypothetical protein ZIOFF_065453 [Zingiber officinale]
MGIGIGRLGRVVVICSYVEEPQLVVLLVVNGILVHVHLREKSNVSGKTSYTTILVLSKVNSNEGAQFPAMFVFGDSLLDPGNNNNLLTLAKANYFPNGIDFSIGTTGRYCNGGTLVDHLGKLLGLPFVPTFKNPSTNGSNILKGVNYASAGAGILWDTGLIFGDVFTMDEQIQNFKKTIEDLSLMLGNKTTDFLGRSLFFISMGANDYINNYLHPLAWRSEYIFWDPYHPTDALNAIIAKKAYKLLVRYKWISE